MNEYLQAGIEVAVLASITVLCALGKLTGTEAIAVVGVITGGRITGGTVATIRKGK